MRSALTLFFAVLLVWGATPDGAWAQGEAKRLRVLKGAFRQTEEIEASLPAREKALKALGELDSRKTAGALLFAAAALEGEIAEIDAQRRALFDKKGGPRVLRSRRVLDRLLDLADEVSRRLLALRDPAARSHLIERAFREHALPFTLRLALIESASPEELPDPRPHLAKKKKDPARFLLGLAAVEARQGRDPRAKSTLFRALGDSRGIIRERAASALGRFADPDVLPALIASLEENPKSDRRAIAKALAHLSGVDLGASPSAWKRWWQDHEEEIRSGRRALGVGAPKEKKDEAKGLAAKSAYYGIPIEGESILFLLDVSHSMIHPIKKGDKEGEKRIERLRKELARTLKSLPPSKRFGIVTFAGRTLAWGDRIIPAQPAKVSAALDWVNKSPLEFGTALYDGIERAFAHAGRPVGDDFHDLAIDTIFILTDGEPYRPNRDPAKNSLESENRERVRRTLHRLNLMDRVVVHTIGLGQGIPAKFLSDLARDHGGRSVHVKE
jgi:HEAT repeats/von Willebrand factor type A domain